jgi:hypothetical protein
MTNWMPMNLGDQEPLDNAIVLCAMAGGALGGVIAMRVACRVYCPECPFPSGVTSFELINAVIGGLLGFGIGLPVVRNKNDALKRQGEVHRSRAFWLFLAFVVAIPLGGLLRYLVFDVISRGTTIAEWFQTAAWQRVLRS